MLHVLQVQAEGGQAEVGSMFHVLRAQAKGQTEVGSVLHVLQVQAEGGQAEVLAACSMSSGRRQKLARKKMYRLTFHFSISKILCFST